MIAAAAVAALVLSPNEQVRPTSRAIGHQPIVPPEEPAQADMTTLRPFAPVPAEEVTLGADRHAAEVFRSGGPAEPRRSRDISDPIPVEKSGRGNWPDVVRIGEPLDADGYVAESGDAREPMPTQIGRTIDVNETDVWSLPRTSVEIIEIGTQLDADAPWPDEDRMLDQAQLALATNKRVTVVVDDSRRHNGYCFAWRIDVIR